MQIVRCTSSLMNKRRFDVNACFSSAKRINAPQHLVALLSHPNGFAIKTKLSDSIAMHSFYIERKMLKINGKHTHTHTMRTPLHNKHTAVPKYTFGSRF